MAAKRKDFTAAIVEYEKGSSVQEIADSYGISRQAMWKALVRRGVEMRRAPALESLVWQGKKYSLRQNGYFARTVEERKYLHRDIWEAKNGPIPSGYEVHHIDENKANNCLENLELLSAAEHGCKHGFGGNQYVPSKGKRPVK